MEPVLGLGYCSKELPRELSGLKVLLGIVASDDDDDE